jgi:hypothetical protein
MYKYTWDQFNTYVCSYKHTYVHTLAQNFITGCEKPKFLEICALRKNYRDTLDVHESMYMHIIYLRGVPFETQISTDRIIRRCDSFLRIYVHMFIKNYLPPRLTRLGDFLPFIYII